MDPLTTRAISDALGKLAKKSRDKLTPGEHPIDEVVTLRVKGAVKVLEDESFTPTAEIPLKTTLALFMHHAGVTGDHAMTALVKAMQEAMAIEALPKKQRADKLAALREIASLEVAEGKVRDGLAELPEKTRKGKVTSVVAIEELPAIKGPAKVVPATTEEAKIA